jgi:vancomycin resistance protein YoaR
MKKWTKVVPVLAAAAVIAAGVSIVDVHAEKSTDTTIADRIYIGDVSVGGMTADEAESAVEAYVEGLSDEIITLTVDDRSVEVTAGELGLTWENRENLQEAAAYGKSGNLIARYKASKDLEHEDKVFRLPLTVDEEKVAQSLEAHADELNRDAVDYGLVRENGEFQITGGDTGIAVDVEASEQILEELFADGWVESPSVELAASITEPKGSEEELAKVKDVLGSFHTNYSSSASGRKKNVANGSQKINGSLIYPGEEFSVYEAVSPFNEENGYALAGSYENGTTVETYGGGICQVSTTLYNAIIRAELEITERYGHSMLVNYVDPSADAAIAGTYKDLKFKNNTDAPIYIESYANGSELGFTVYGEETRPSNRSISFVSETLSTTEPTVQFQASSDPIGSISKTQSSHTGKSAQLWKVVTVDGVEQSRTVFNKTTYSMSPTIYSVGTSSSNAEAVAAMKAAIATQDESTIRAAAAQWNDAAVQAAAAQAEAEAQAAAEAAAAQEAAQTTPTDPSTETGGETSDGGQ